MSTTTIAKAEWSTAEVDNLPDSAFLHIEQGGEKDSEGKTKPRSLRHFPVYDAQGQLDLPHLRNAIARIPQASSEWLSASEKERLQEKARKLLADAQKTTHKRAAGLPDWAIGYAAHADEHEALGLDATTIGKSWRGDAMIGKRAADLLRSVAITAPERGVSKRITKAIDKLLRTKVAVHNASAPKFQARIGMAKAAYQRGVAAYQKVRRPCVKSAPQWGFARADALLSFCKTGSLPHPSYTADLDLFPIARLKKDELGTSDLAAGGVLVPEQGLSSKLEHRTFAGLPVVVDRPKGFVQRKVDDAGKLLWERTYKTDYGYIPSTLGGDEEELDVFLGPDAAAPIAFWFVQVDDQGDFDEFKVVLGVGSEDAAREIYLAHIPEKYMGRMFEMPVGAMHALLGIEPTDLLKGIEPGYHFVAGPDGELYTAHPWTSLGMSANPGDDEDAPARAPQQPLRLSAEAHAEMAAAVGAVKALRPTPQVKFVTPLVSDAAPAYADALSLFSSPDPLVADVEAILSAAEQCKAALVELPESARNVAQLAKLNGVFKLDGAPGRVWIATYPLPVTATEVEPLEDDAIVWKAVDQEEIDLVYAKYHATVNMSASELDAWSQTECSKLASLDRRPIQRNLKLLRTPKAEWGASEVAQANKTIAFVARMKNMEQGEPAREGCPSKRDISLKNWAYDPGKKSAAAPDIETCPPGVTCTPSPAFPAEETPTDTVSKAGTILQIGKADGTDERYTLGIVLVPDVPDLQGDVVDKPTIRRAADVFMADYQNTALQHNVAPADIQSFHDENPNLYNGKILIVDSFVIPDEMGDVMINGRLVRAGTWLMGHRWIDDALWADVKAGKYTGLSMGGFARRVAIGGATA